MLATIGQSSRCPSQMVLGKAWTSLPCSQPTKVLQNPLLLWFRLLQRAFRDLLAGSIVVIASDTILDIPLANHSLDWTTLQSSSVVALSVPALLNVAKNHGVFVPRNNPQILLNQSTFSPCANVYQKPSLDVLKQNCSFPRPVMNQQPTASGSSGGSGNRQAAWIDTGVICFLPGAAQALKDLVTSHSSCQTLRCTKHGLQQLWENEIQCSSHNNPSLVDFAQKSALAIDLYTHFLNALRHSSTSLSEEAAASERLDLLSYCAKYQDELSHDAASLIYNTLSQNELVVWTEPAGSFLHLGTTRELMQFLLAPVNPSPPSPTGTMTTDAEELRFTMASRLGLEAHLNAVLLRSVEDDDHKGETAFVSQLPPATSVVMESFLQCKDTLHVGERSVIEHTFLNEGSICIGDDCLISGLRSKKKTTIRHPGLIIPNSLMVQEVARKSGDHVFVVLGIDDSSKAGDCIYGRPMDEFLKWAGLERKDLWMEPSPNKHQLWNAKIHPVCYGCDEDDGGDDNNGTFMSLFSWLTSFCSGSDGDHAQSLQRWKTGQRLSLADIRQSAHAPTEFGFRARLSSLVSRDWGHNSRCRSLEGVFQEQEDWLFSLRRVLLTRQHKEIEFSGLIPSVPDDTDNLACIQTFHAIDEVIADSFEGAKYDICGRAFLLQNAMMEDLSNAPWTQSPDCEECERKLLHHISQVTGRNHFQNTDIRIEMKNLSEHFCRALGGQIDKIHELVEQFALARDLILKINQNLLSPSLTVVADEFARIMTKHCVVGYETKTAILASPIVFEQLVLDRWILAVAPARIDIAGGWTDTPPICFDFGSCVTGLAVSVDGKKPLSCRSRLIQGSSGVLLKSEHRNWNGELISSEHVELGTVDEMKGYNSPSSTCALLKCALVTIGLISTDEISECNVGENSLSSVMSKRCNSAGPLSLQVVVTSLLPHGSGMGSSSILAGCVLASIGKCLGFEIGPADLVHYVIALEQELTTGGGFQDQVNGLVGGAKIVSCQPLQFPLELSICQLELDEKFQSLLDENLILIYTGRTRLAKNILQNCCRRWATRNPLIVRNVEGLIRNAHAAKKSLLSSSLRDVGNVLSLYWEQKKVMAGDESGVEPEVVSQICKGLLDRGIIHGASMCGAGGGGFLALVKSEEVTMPDFLLALREIVGEELNSSMSVHTCAISNHGLTLVSLPESNSMDLEFFESAWLDT